MRSKGFTLFETMITITIFSVLMIIVFSCWTEFQKVFIKNEGKQDANVQFVNVYRNIDKVVSSSSVRLFSCCDDTTLASIGMPTHENLRWSSFLISRNNHQLDGEPVYRQETGGSRRLIIYNTCVVFLLHYNSGCCGSFSQCPHKSLYRYIFPIDDSDGGVNNEIYFSSGYPWGVHFKQILTGSVENILSNHNAIPHSVVENNIVNFRVDKQDDKLQYYLDVLRIKDAERHFQIGSKNLIDPDDETKKFLEHLSWISIPNNT